jgi:hypothetical protein
MDSLIGGGRGRTHEQAAVSQLNDSGAAVRRTLGQPYCASVDAEGEDKYDRDDLSQHF